MTTVTTKSTMKKEQFKNWHQNRSVTKIHEQKKGCNKATDVRREYKNKVINEHFTLLLNFATFDAVRVQMNTDYIHVANNP